MSNFKEFIKENIALSNSQLIGIYNKKGNRVGWIPLLQLTPPDNQKKLYSFGALSDVHYQYDTAPEDFHKALTYLNNQEDVAFTCVCGDLTTDGTAAELNAYKKAVDTYSKDTPVYAITGNHDVHSGLFNQIENYTGHPAYYSINYKDDVYIFVGNSADQTTEIFTQEELQWLYETLEENRNKRCFVFEHVRPQDGCGNAFGIYNYDIWGDTCAEVFESLMKHYHNVILFHGHSHLKFYLQYGSDIANYDNIFGCHSIHIPSLSVPRDGDAAGASSRREVYSESEGYVVDVYENGIHLRGRDFVKEEFLPIASYWLDTTPVNIEANTYIDTTGTIQT